MHLSIIYTHTYSMYTILSCPRAVRRGPRFIIIGELNRSLVQRDNRCGTHPTTAAVCYYYVLLLLYAHYVPTTRARGRRPGRNVSSTSDARGGPPQTNDHNTSSDIVAYDKLSAIGVIGDAFLNIRRALGPGQNVSRNADCIYSDTPAHPNQSHPLQLCLIKK